MQSRLLDPRSLCFQNYVAPEVIKGQYHPAPADMWSLGVVTYVLMSRMLPFDADTTEGIQRNILSGRFVFKGGAWAGASEASKHFVRSLLLKSADLRLTAAGAQKHDWLREAEDLSQTPRKDSTFREEVTRSLLSFREANPMKQLALEVVARTLDPTQIRQLAEEFDRADNNNNGEVSLAEFKRWLEANGAARGMADEDVEASFNSVDVDHSGFIHFNEFLAATIQQRHMDEQSLRPAFDRLDRSHTGFINLDDVTLTTGAAANEEESRVLVGHFDMNGDGQISFEEFVNGMRRMGGSSRDGGGLLSIPPAATPAPPASASGSPREDATTVPEREPA
ncbi:n/a [Ectocarpus siliculosus]|uniref:N/a n=1 Tax=Ectocarpus siliculosus TaxID=2880 RepID=D8LT00_ECTSI|nr:n/a [Ectocarpus siliculosus]|eukprot:CBN77927.1 n/a [Ectocarpus siliculosus]